MKCYFRSFDAGIGDCNVIRLIKDDGTQYAIMVDCGKYTQAIKEYVRDVLHNHIDLLIATHIDGDHILGLTNMLSNHEGLLVDNIWYNSYRRTNIKTRIELNEQQKKILEQIKQALPVEFDAINYREISNTQGKSLAKTILEKETLYRVWRTDYITDQTTDFILPNDFGKIVLLGPKHKALQTIEKKFKNAFDEYFMQIWNESIDCGEELQELLIRLIDSLQSRIKKKTVASIKGPIHNAAFVRNAAKDETLDDSDTNYSSIAFMLECNGHKIAMLGDAFASTIEDTIVKKYSDDEKPIACEAIKVSHHGSNGNNSKTLCNLISSHRYFIPGGKGTEYPTWGTFGRIVESNKDEYPKLLVFSHTCDMTELINGLSSEDKADLGVETIITEQEYELFEC
jgi:beta-lactamase superfamily II metal-dependent hydrolase